MRTRIQTFGGASLGQPMAEARAEVQRGLYAHVTERGWFRANPQTVRTRWYVP